MIHLRSIAIDEARRGPPETWPFGIDVVRSFESLDLDRPVTFFVGENGSGKSTLLEAIAWAAECVAAGSEPLEQDASLDAIRPLASALRLVWNKRTRRGFFLRSEDFFGYVKEVKTSLAHWERESRRVKEENPHLAQAELERIRSPFAGSARELRGRYGEDMDARSHGEQFISFFQSRLVPGGLYLLDEPEVPLSPTRQLGLLSILMDQSREHDCQFIVATHSPILLALPGATIYSFEAGALRRSGYEELEHVQLMRRFLNSPEAFLRHL